MCSHLSVSVSPQEYRNLQELFPYLGKCLVRPRIHVLASVFGGCLTESLVHVKVDLGSEVVSCIVRCLSRLRNTGNFGFWEMSSGRCAHIQRCWVDSGCVGLQSLSLKFVHFPRENGLAVRCLTTASLPCVTTHAKRYGACGCGARCWYQGVTSDSPCPS